MTAVRRLAGALAAGGLAGLAALVLDGLLDLFTLGHAAPLAARFVAAYVLSGAVAGLLVELAWRKARRSAVELFAAVLALLYAPPIFERVFFALEVRLGTPAAAGAAALAVAGYGAWIALLRRVSRAWAPAVLSGAATAATVLAIQRNLVERPFAPPSLAAVAAVGAAGLAFALLVRRAGARRALAAAAALVAAVALAAALHRLPPAAPAASDAAGQPANLLLVVIDTLRQDVFEAVVEETEEGRALESRLEGAAWFDRAVAAAPWTNPSVASILTGLYPAEHGFGATALADALPETVPTLAGKLRRRGYRTEALVANPILYPASGIYRGFHRYEVLSGSTSRLPLLTALARAGLVREDLYQDSAAVRRRLASRLDTLERSRPFFLWLLLMDPHAPLRGHRDLSPDPGAAGLHPQERLYRDEVRFALRELARTIDLLEDRGLWRTTLLVLVSDHGESFPTDGRDHDAPGVADGGETWGRHGHALYRELVRVPLVVRPPGASGATRRVDVLTSHVDLHDTTLDLLGLDAPRIGRDRVSVAPWITPDPAKPPPRQAALSSLGSPPAQRALETAAYKLIDHPGADRGSELFDTAADPRERRDLAVERSQLLAELSALLDALWSQQTEPPAARSAPYDRATLERLKALGYVE